MAGTSISGGCRPFFLVILLHSLWNSYFSGITEIHIRDEISMPLFCNNHHY